MKATLKTDGITMTHSALSISLAGMSSGRRRISSITMPQFSSRSRFLVSAAPVDSGSEASAMATNADKIFLMSSPHLHLKDLGDQTRTKVVRSRALGNTPVARGVHILGGRSGPSAQIKCRRGTVAVMVFSRRGALTFGLGRLGALKRGTLTLKRERSAFVVGFSAYPSIRGRCEYSRFK